MVAISVIIPTLNEASQLPTLLTSLEKQSFRNFEIIVADAGSKDETRDLARSAGAQIVSGGRPAKGRNRGAEAAQGEFLFFLDADVSLPPDFLEKSLGEMEEDFLDLATCEFRPLSELRLDRVLFQMSNLYVRFNQKINPRAAGFCIFITKRLFRRIGGFDEELHLAEDHDLVKRASQFRSLHFLKSTHLMVSVRRLEKEGRFKLMEKYFQAEWLLLTKGRITDPESISYEFSRYQEENEESQDFLDELERKLIELDRSYGQISNK